MAVPLVLLFALFAGNFLGCAGRGVQDGGSQATLPAASLEETRGGTSIGGMANYAIVSGMSIAASLIGGVLSSFLLELVVYPPVCQLWKWHFELKPVRRESLANEL